jgi:hypothetical protein
VTALTEAWQAALAAEHAAVFGYGLLGPRAGADTALAAADQAAHERLRDATTAALAAAGAAPVPPAADYPALYPVPDQAAARRSALRLEDDCAAPWRSLFLQAQGRPALRRTAQANLTASAVRAVRWRRLVDPRHPATAFPGL